MQPQCVCVCVCVSLWACACVISANPSTFRETLLSSYEAEAPSAEGQYQSQSTLVLWLTLRLYCHASTFLFNPKWFLIDLEMKHGSSMEQKVHCPKNILHNVDSQLILMVVVVFYAPGFEEPLVCFHIDWVLLIPQIGWINRSKHWPADLQSRCGSACRFTLVNQSTCYSTTFLLSAEFCLC